MPRNGSGGYVPPAGQPVVTGTSISSSVFNALVADLGSELTKSICTDGQTPMTANLPMGNNRITGLAVGINPTDAAQFAQLGDYLPTAGGQMTGNVNFANNSGLFFKDSNGVLRQVFVYAPDNNIYTNLGQGGLWNLQNAASTQTVFQINNDGIANVGGVTLRYGAALRYIESGGTTRNLAYATSDNYFNYFGGATGTRWFNAIGSVVLASLTGDGNFSAITLTQTSDERKKKLWQRLPHDFVAQLANIKKSGLFTWKKGGTHGVGVGAQSLERILPTAVHTDEKGAKTVNYGAAAMVSVVELARALVAAEKRIADQELRLAALEAK